MTIEMPIELPMLRISVHSAVPFVRRSHGSVAKAIVFSGTKMKPSPKPWARDDVQIVRADVSGEISIICASDHVDRDRPMKMSSARIDPAHQAADEHHGDDRADAARAQQQAGVDHGIAHQVLQ